MQNKQRTLFENTKRFLMPALKNKLITFKAILMYIVWGIPGIIHVLFIQHLVFLLENNEKQEFIRFSIFYGLYIIFHEVLEYIVRRWGRVEDIKSFRSVIHREYMKKFVSLDSNTTEMLGTGKMIAMIDRGMDTWALLIDHFLLNFTKTLIVFVFAFFMIAKVNLLYAFIFLFIYICIHFLGAVLNSKSLAYRRKRLIIWNEYVRNIVKIIMNKFEILQTGKIKMEIDYLNNINNNLQEQTYKMSDYIHWFYRLSEGVLILIKYSLIVYLGFQILDGKSNISTLVGIFGILALMDQAINRSMTFFKDFTKSFSTIEKLWDFFDTTPQISGYEEGNKFKYKKGKIEIKDLTYGYTKNKPVFKNFNLKLKGEKITALVGNSGSGKSTLVKLIAGYIKPNSGEIIVDGQKLSETSLKSYYKEIGYLTQEPSVFDGTVLDNLTYAVENPPIPNQASPHPNPLPKGEGMKGGFTKNCTASLPLGEIEGGQEVILKKIIKLSKCEFIYDLPNGIHTEIGEKGIRLSGGQRQRLAIAKIMLKDPKIILLDEPTSALDSFSEEQITKAMNNLFKNRTVIIIAHRLQTVKHADDIILIENGQIKERGTHKELVKQKGIYKKMLDLQSGF